MESPVQSARGVGLHIPDRESDCSGHRPSWYPVVVNVCDQDAPDPIPLTERQKQLPPPAGLPDWHP